MTVYIIWPHSIDEMFRDRYGEVVGESIQDIPKNNGTHFMIGSSRCTHNQALQLIGEFAGVFMRSEFPPEFLIEE